MLFYTIFPLLLTTHKYVRNVKQNKIKMQTFNKTYITSERNVLPIKFIDLTIIFDLVIKYVHIFKKNINQNIKDF